MTIRDDARAFWREAGPAISAILSGMGATFRHFWGPAVTYQYPEQKKPVALRHRGLHVLQRYADGLERCVGCHLCSAACPADAIFVEAAENDPAHPVSPGERYAKTYEINLLRCIFCGFCEDACPVEAVVLKQNYELAMDRRDKFIVHKDDLLVKADQGFGENLYVGGMGF
ncbi:MAG: NADH-quinone oxidoreductase subunit 9 [bacterium]|nr:NADH-quinone oxidoreductase subunit 9 [bacterium]